MNNKTHQEIILKLSDFKSNIREAIQSDTTTLPISSVQKVFSFQSLSIVDQSKQPFVFNLKTLPLLLRLLEIIEVSLDQLEKGQIITKRNLYYKLGKYYAGKYNLIDNDLDILSFNTQLTKNQLRIFSSSRCLLFGEVTISHNRQPLQCNCNTITNIPLAQHLGPTQTTCTRLIIVEKESAMYQIHQELSHLRSNQQKGQTNILKETIFISSKGYPDSTTRRLIQTLLPLVTEIYYLGDSDIYGAQIILCYSISKNGTSTFLPRVRWIKLQLIVEALRLEPEVQQQKKEDIIKGIQILQRTYLQDIQLFLPVNEQQKQFKEKMMIWKDRIIEMKCRKFKIELEAFFKEMPINWINLVIQNKYWL